MQKSQKTEVDRFNGGWQTPPPGVNDFCGGTLQGVIDKLDYIKCLILGLGGKTYFICVMGERACRQGWKTLCFTMNTLIEQLRLVHLEGRETSSE